jgi:antibiotic biosynthesis monooxygenase (ABM) superfamily enzyme
MTIVRLWRGWTAPENADAYQALLHNHIFPAIEAKKIPGYRSIALLRLDRGEEVEFVTLMTFDSLEDVVGFQGPDYRFAYVPDAARRVLKRWDALSDHYEIVEKRAYR